MIRSSTLLFLLSATALADTPYDKARPSGNGGGYRGLGAGSMKPEEVAKYAPPSLPPAISRRIQTMSDVRAAGGGTLTSRGDRMFFATAITGTSQVFRQDGPMKLPIQLTGGEDRTSVVDIAPNDAFVVVSRDVGGEENPGLYLMPPGGGPLRVVLHAPNVKASLSFISDDSKSLYYRANDVRPESYSFYRYDVATGKRELLFDESGIWSMFDHRGDTWLVGKELGDTQIEIYEYTVSSKKLAPIIGQNEKEQYEAYYGGKPGEILILTNKLGDFRRLYRLEGQKLAAITPEVKHDITKVKIDDARTRIYFELAVDGFTKLSILDAKSARPVALPKLPPADNVRVGEVSRNGRFVTLTTDGATSPGQSVVFDWKTKRSTTWRVPSTPEVDTSRFAQAKLESYPARDGTKIPMFVRRPQACTEPCPVIVEFHGGPARQATAGFNATAQLFVDAGFVFVQPNVRGSEGYGKTWLGADDGPKRLAVITDIEDVSKYIRTAWAKNGRAPKLGVMGGSYGGYATLMAMTYFAGAFDAGVQEIGISNLVSFLENTSPYRRISRMSEYGDPTKDHDALVQLSPITHVGKLRAPLLSIQGLNDPRVPVGEAVQIYKELERRKIPGGLIIFPDEGHGTVKRNNRVLKIGHTIGFFEKHLQGK